MQTVRLDELRFVGSELVRPECVLTTPAGDLYTADWRGGVAHILPDGSQKLYRGELSGDRPLRPNGIALHCSGSFLLADLGESQGGVFELTRTGQVRPFLVEVSGIELPPTNFVAIDRYSRIWVTVSTRKQPRTLDFRPDCASGFIVLDDGRGPRVVADGIGYTNEAVVSPDNAWLYVNETYGRRLSRFPIRPDNTLGSKEVVTTFGEGTFPDGLTFDSEGYVWVTSIISNRVIRVAPDGSQQIVLEDADPATIGWCEAAYLSGTMAQEHVNRAAGQLLKNISSLAFGGPDLRTIYLGSLHGSTIPCFRSPVAGNLSPHWSQRHNA
jgi:sugar lactone lactonase YvrE